MSFKFVYIYRHIYRKWVFLVDTKCQNTVILTRLTYTSSRNVFHDGCAKIGTFSHQILNKNSLSLAHCALNRSFTVYHLFQEIRLSEFYFLLCIYLFYKVFQNRRLALPNNFWHIYHSTFRIDHRFHVFTVIILFL